MISTSKIMRIMKSALTLCGAERAYGQALGEDICKKVMMSNCRTTMMMIMISLDSQEDLDYNDDLQG